VSRNASEQSAKGPYRSKSVRTGAALTARLFGAQTSLAPRRTVDDQSCIRAAIRRRRRTLGLTQDAAAQILGLKRLTYHRIEHGPRRIRLPELAIICALYNCDIGEIVQDAELAHAAKALLAAEQTHPTS
jgi:DNA-binding XRE family transcriptional regulator